MASPHNETRPMRLLSPDWCRVGVNPNAGPTERALRKRAGMSIVAVKASKTTGPSPGIVINRRQTLSSFSGLSLKRSGSFVHCSQMNS